MSHLVRLLETKSRDPTARAQRVHHVWVIREADNIEWIQQELDWIKELDLPDDFLTMSFYVSQAETETSAGPEIGNGKSQRFPHRADIPAIIANEAQQRLGTLAVVGSSPFPSLINRSLRTRCNGGSSKKKRCPKFDKYKGRYRIF
jgi:hypothetical protein